MIFGNNNSKNEKEAGGKDYSLMSAIFEEMPFSVKLFDNKGRLIMVNNNGRKKHFLENKTDEEIKKWDYMECIEKEYRPLVREKMNDALKGIPGSFEMKHIQGTSRGTWCASTLVPVKDSKGETNYVLFLSRDITEEKAKENEHKNNLEEITKAQTALLNILEDIKESEKNLREEKDRSEAIISSMGESLLVIDKNYKIILINKAAVKSIGLAEKDIVGNDIRKIILILKNDRAISDEERLLEKVLSGQGALIADLKDNFYYKVSSGKKFPVSFISTPLLGDEGVIGAVLVFRDITDQKALDESKSSFISIASHQLRTPLTSLRWASEMLIGGDAGPLGDEQKHFVEKIYEATDRMIELVNLLLQIARVEAGRVKVEPAPVNLKDFTDDVVSSLKVNLDSKFQNVKISVEPEKFPLIPIDKEIIWQVAQNLISNASRYSPEKSLILISIVEKNGYVEYSVKDNGIGIPVDQKDRIFEKFFRAQNALRTVPEGSGLGLSLVKYLVEDWGGKIWFESDEGKGATFFFTIPVEGMKAKEGDVKLSVLE